jgi:phenylacetate-CoA ligase
MISLARRRLTSRNLDSETENPLEEWIHMRVRQTLREEREFRRDLGRSSLSEVSREDLRCYQMFKFRKLMRYVDENSVYYHKVMTDNKLTPNMFKEFEDLARFPLTEPASLAEEPFHFLCVSQSKVMRAFSTSGTSGLKKRLFYTREDVLNIVDAISAALKTVGLKEKETLQIMFPAVTAWDPSLMLESACKVAGLNAVVCSSIDIDVQVEMMRKSETRMLIGLTSFIYRITMLARDKYDLRSLGIKAIICSSEPLSESMRKELESAWGCKALTQYGMTEMGLATAIECTVQDGIHVDEADYLVECIDPETGHQSPDRKDGELVWTSLNMGGSPLLRYRSYDLSCYISPPCGCGFRTVGKIGKPKGRIDQTTKFGFGEKIYPYLFDEAIGSVHGVISHQVVIDRPSFRDRLTVTVEFNGDLDAAKQQLWEKVMAIPEVQSSLENDLMEPLVVNVVGVRSEFVPTKRTLVDNREQYDR